MADLNYDVNNPGEPWLPEPPLPPTLSSAETLTSILLSFPFLFFLPHTFKHAALDADTATFSHHFLLLPPLPLSHPPSLPACPPVSVVIGGRDLRLLGNEDGARDLRGTLGKSVPCWSSVTHRGVEQFNGLRFAERGCVLEA